MQNEGDPWKKTFYHRAIQTHIGRALRARYDLSQPMPDELARLVMRIDFEVGARGSGESGDETGSSGSRHRHGGRPPRPLPGTS